MNGVIIVAAGTGSRMNAGINKQFIKLNEKEILVHTIENFYNKENIGEIIIVSKENEIEYVRENILNKYNFKNIKLIIGGKERQDSVYNGLKALDKNCEIVLVHDGARPFISEEIIDKSIEEAKVNSAIVVGVPVKDTIKVIDNNNQVVNTPKRDQLWSVQTPQVFKYKLLKEAYEKAYNDGYYGTDDSMLVERLGCSVKMIEGSYNNIKITTIEDLGVGEQILNNTK